MKGNTDMSNRLISKFTKCKKGSLGYTLTELLVVIGIVVVLLAIAIPSVLAISKSLKFAQRNDYAKSIFMAAQANLTEMRADGGLTPLQSENVNSLPVTEELCGFPVEDWSPEYVYTSSDLAVNDTARDSYTLVLPVGSVDGTIREQHVIIEYNPVTGNVYAVFYCEEDLVGGTGSSLLDLYRNNQLPRNGEGDEAKRKKLMVGYYDGSGLSSAQLEIERTEARITFENGEEAIVTVHIPMPDLYVGAYNEFMKGLEVKLNIEGEKSHGRVEDILVKSAGTLGSNCKLDVDGKTVLVTYVIDSLKARSSFVNLITNTMENPNVAQGMSGSGVSLTKIANESTLVIKPGENVTLEAEVTFYAEEDRPNVAVQNALLKGVNPLFDSLSESLIDDGKLTLTVTNGRNLQNLNAIAPSVAQDVTSLVFGEDIYWNYTVAYYNNKYGTNGTYNGQVGGVYDEAPARALPYFVPIHNESLFGTARFIYLDGSEGEASLLEQILSLLPGIDFVRNDRVPTLTDELDSQTGADGKTIAQGHARIEGNGHSVYYLNINSNIYQVPNEGGNNEGKFYATGDRQIIDYYFTGLFGYVNTTISNLSVVNPIIKGHEFVDKQESTTIRVNIGIDAVPIWVNRTINTSTYSNPATGSLVGACGYNTYLYNCSTYLNTGAGGFNWNYIDHGNHVAQKNFSASGTQDWYGVSGAGAVGGLVGYAKSHRTTTGALGDSSVLAFNSCFASVPVSGHLRGDDYQYDSGTYDADSGPDKDFGYSNGVGGLIGNAQLTNFYNCYASGNVRVDNTYCQAQTINGDTLRTILGLGGNGRLSMGGGGFVGTSHGTRFTNCFASGNVTRTSGTGTMANAGGFVGMMCYDETKTYGHHGGGSYAAVAQHTIFENCYAVGMCIDGNGNFLESFAGGTGTIGVKKTTLSAYYNADYYRLLAPYRMINGVDPEYQTDYIFKDSYYLSQYVGNAAVSQEESKKCANPIGYSDLQRLQEKYDSANWINLMIEQLKTYSLDVNVAEAAKEGTEDYLKAAGFSIILDLPEIFEIFRSDDNYDFYFKVYKFLSDRNLRPGNLEDHYFNSYTRGYPSTIWENAQERTTHYYGEASAGMVYPFPKLGGMDYYGTWPAEPLTGGLAYYEKYDDGHDGYYFDRADTSSLRSAEDTVITEDGYAVFSGTKDDIIYIYDASGKLISGALTPETTGITLSSPYSPDNSSYYVTRIPESVLKQLVPGGDGFYSAIMIQVINGEGKTGYYWALFNPNTGISQVNNVQWSNGQIVYRENPESVMIRSARQFNALSEERMQGVWSDENVTIIQQLHIDAEAYHWTGITADGGIPSLKAIGSQDHPFNATYTGAGGYVSQAKIQGFEIDAPIFGYVGSTGTVSNLDIRVEDDLAIGSAEADYVGLLAAVSAGTIENVDLTFDGNVNVTAKTAAGLLVGYVPGTEADNARIGGCDISAKNVTVKAENAGAVIGKAVYCDIQDALDSENLSDDMSLTVSTKLTLNGTDTGAVLGYAENLDLDGMAIQVEAITATAVRTGTLAGTLDSGSVKNLTITVENTYQAQCADENATIAGVAAVAKKALVQNVTVHINGTLSGDIAAGVFGKTLDLTVQTTQVNIAGTVSGAVEAAGMAASVESGEFSGANVNFINGKINSLGRAAGFAVTVKGQVSTGLVTTLNPETETSKLPTTTGQIIGATEAAGFACEISAQVSGSRVAGKLTVSSSEKAAGFAVKITGNRVNVSTNGVTPALENTTKGYMGNDNENLTVHAKTAALFALEVGSEVNVTNCYALGTVTGDVRTGFVDTNNGILDGCSTNVTIEGGNAFVRSNTGVVSNSYGWYGNGNREDEIPTVSVIEEGTVVSSYFVDLDIPVDEESISADVYDNLGGHKYVSALTMTAKDLNGENGSRWFAAGTYSQYPYGKLIPAGYPYPMLRVHYGNWSTPPRYGYGIMYYEIYSDASWKLEIRDMSDLEISGRYTYAGDQATKVDTTVEEFFNNDGTILEAGYAVFFKDKTVGDKELPAGLSLLGAAQGDSLTMNLAKNTPYTVYKLNVEGMNATLKQAPVYEDEEEKTLSFNSWYAHEFETGLYHVVRTEGQFDLVMAIPGGSFKQTHDIDLVSFRTVENFSGSYDGNNLTIQKSGAVGTWMTAVSGSVTNVNLVLGDLDATVFGQVSNTVSLNSLRIGSVGQNGNLIDTLTGTLTCGSNIQLQGNLDGALIGTVSNTAANSWTLEILDQTNEETGETTAYTVGGTVIGTVSTGSAVDLNLVCAQGKDIPGAIVNNVAGTFTLKNDPQLGNVTGSLFGSVSGTLTLEAGITVDTLTGALVNTLTSGTVTTGNVTVETLNASLVKEFNGGKLTGTTVTVINGIAVPLFTGELKTGAEISGITVTGNVTLDGSTANGALVNVNNGNMNGLTLKADQVTVEAAETATIGTLVGVNYGYLTGCKLEGTAENAAAAVTITGTEAKTLVFGGLAGENAGAINGTTEIDAEITYIQPLNPDADKQDSLTMGGLVGKMSGGTLEYATVTGSIGLTDQANLDYEEALKNLKEDEEPPVQPAAPAATGRSYIIGGAVGQDSGATYQYNTSSVTVASAWTGANVLTSAENPMGRGPVGMFVGYVTTGNFTTCSSTAENSTYQFLGQILISYGTLGDSGDQTWFGHATNTGNNTYESSTDKTLENAGQENGFNISYADGTQYETIAAALTDCTFNFGQGDTQAVYTQVVQIDEYFHLGLRQHLPAGKQLIEMTGSNPNDNRGTSYVITNTNFNRIFTGNSSGAEIPAPGIDGRYYTIDQYNAIAKWSIEYDDGWFSDKYSWKYNGQYLYLLHGVSYTTDRKGLTSSISLSWKGNGYTINGTSASLASTNNGFNYGNLNNGVVRIWYFGDVAESFKFHFNYQNGCFRESTGIRDANGNVVSLTSTASVESDLPADSGEATQATEVPAATEIPAATESSETATVPPAAEDGKND